ncbi:Os03g0660600 [Oryza sativa Japonica Group]|uniref:Os03g0660600 protein n=1 Tax=Oryza sativa subsp. japonica TaxID=39947 RepID=A0A0P0W116_ORYSJ|nr:Os03g0660600 [Oryza sativa Japonica Group]
MATRMASALASSDNRAWVHSVDLVRSPAAVLSRRPLRSAAAAHRGSARIPVPLCPPPFYPQTTLASAARLLRGPAAALTRCSPIAAGLTH